LIKRLEDEAGYSLVEVMASIMILAIAIIPMVGMFDMGLQTATRGSNYDKARAFANQQLEQTKALSYEHVKNNFPTASSTPNPDFSATLTVPTGAGLPLGSTYTVAKRYVSTNAANPSFSNASSDQGLIRITITVYWSGNSYTTVGLKAR
jgi:prepilin-type N-terminal cleavage/methylation domain-containing protein